MNIALMLALMGGQFGLEKIWDYMSPLSPKEKELMELKLKGGEQSSNRELQAMQLLQKDKSNDDWMKILMQLGTNQAQDARATGERVAELSANAGMMRNHGNAIGLVDPVSAREASMMTQPTNYKQILGLEQ